MNSRGKNAPDFGSGLKSCQTISSPYISTPSSFHNCEISPFGSGGPPPPNMPIIPPPGGRFGCAVPTTSPPGGNGNGSSKIAVGCPLFTAATKFVIASGDSEEGCTASSTSYLSLIGFDASTSTTSY